jgi:D-tyrosyl-tRNA(Tyr) deacylase
MIGLLQRVTSAHVTVTNAEIARIEPGLLVFVGVEPSDTKDHAERLLKRLLGYRLFEDTNGKMNLSLQDIEGGLLLVPQFTLAANTQKGLRPSFTSAAPPELGERLFEHLCHQAGLTHPVVACGEFSADMQVSLVNDGPATFWLQV